MYSTVCTVALNYRLRYSRYSRLYRYRSLESHIVSKPSQITIRIHFENEYGKRCFCFESTFLKYRYVTKSLTFSSISTLSAPTLQLKYTMPISSSEGPVVDQSSRNNSFRRGDLPFRSEPNEQHHLHQRSTSQLQITDSMDCGLERKFYDNNADQVNDDNDNITVITIQPQVTSARNNITLDWINQSGPEMAQHRRTVLLREIQRIQRVSFLQFALLCLIPSVMIIVVLWESMMGGTEDCSSEATHCILEARTFMNAFTTRCVCEAIQVLSIWESGEDPLN